MKQVQLQRHAIDSLEIKAPVENVYGLVYNIANWPAWLNGVTETHLNGNAEEGKEFRFKANGYKIKSKLHTAIPNQAIGWTGSMMWVKAVHNWWFIKIGNNLTKVIVKENYYELFTSTMQKSLEEGIHKNLLALRKSAEK